MLIGVEQSLHIGITLWDVRPVEGKEGKSPVWRLAKQDRRTPRSPGLLGH